MHTLYRRLVVTSLLLLLAHGLAPLASASPAIPDGGAFTVTNAVESNVRFAGPVKIYDWQVFFENTGALDGPSVALLHCVVGPSGQGRCHGRETFTGTVAGRSGTSVFYDTIAVDTVRGTVQGQYVIISGTGGLAALRGGGTFQAVGANGTYTMKARFVG
jgi:hypothetical protein